MLVLALIRESLLALMPADLPRLNEVHFDGRIVGLAWVLSLVRKSCSAGLRRCMPRARIPTATRRRVRGPVAPAAADSFSSSSSRHGDRFVGGADQDAAGGRGGRHGRREQQSVPSFSRLYERLYCAWIRPSRRALTSRGIRDRHGTQAGRDQDCAGVASRPAGLRDSNHEGNDGGFARRPLADVGVWRARVVSGFPWSLWRDGYAV
jgi:hypothetical protein